MQVSFRKRSTAFLTAVFLVAAALSGCGSNNGNSGGKVGGISLADGVYSADFTTDSGMFHVNEAHDGKGTLTVKGGEMFLHISLVSQNIVNLYPGLAADAEKEGAAILEPTLDTVTYSDGDTEEVYGFDIPVPALDEEFNMAILGAKGKWYDHKVKVSNPVDITSTSNEQNDENKDTIPLEYARGFSIERRPDGCRIIKISNQGSYLVVPEGKEVPFDAPEDATVVLQPVDHIYIAASAVMDMFVSMDALDKITLSGREAERWYIDEAKKAMESGSISYAGKYSAPDYEMITSEGCKLAIESMMISHAPEVKEKLEELGVVVLTDQSSNESHPLGRAEWVKVYGTLTGMEDEAKQAFDRQKELFDSVAGGEDTGKTVAFFAIDSNGLVNVRTPDDYVSKLIEMAGAEYKYSEYGEAGMSTSVNMQMEEFYSYAKDADYLIYNGTIDGGVATADELLSKSPLIADFKAVAEGNIYCTSRNLYQKTMDMGTFIVDLGNMLHPEKGETGFVYLTKLK